MALTQATTIQTTAGLPVDIANAYIKVASVIADTQIISSIVHTYTQSSGLIATSQTYQFKHDLEGPNPIKQAYLYLKTLPEFADAIDC